MSNLAIENLQGNFQPIDAERSFTESTKHANQNFSKILEDSFEKVNLYQTQADVAVKELVSGRTKNIHEALLTVERADISLKMMMQVRNKILDAYREIMRMQI